MKTKRLHLIVWFNFVLFLFVGLNAASQKTSKAPSTNSTQRSAIKPDKVTTTVSPAKISKPVNSISIVKSKTKTTNPRTNIQSNTETRANSKTSPTAFHEEELQNPTQNETAQLPVKSEIHVLDRNDLYYNFWRKYNVQNRKQAVKQMRHCGCAGDIEYINQTQDTLNFYFAYLTPLETPTLEDAVLPPVKYNHPFAAFSLIPGDSATVRGSCMGGLQYEVTTRKNRFTGQGHERPDVYINKFVRLSCMPKTLIISEDMEGISE